MLAETNLCLMNALYILNNAPKGSERNGTENGQEISEVNFRWAKRELFNEL